MEGTLISRHELSRHALEQRVPEHTVERDYVLDWFLHFIDERFTDSLLFKGGTCIRKLWIPEWRDSRRTWTSLLPASV